MNNIYTLFIVLLIVSFTSVNAQNREYTIDTMSMHSLYANDIFYSMSEGEIANIPRAGWDIAFYTPAFSAGIIINEGSNVMLYSYQNGDTSAWAHIDTTGLSTWTPLYNSAEYWEDGAFNKGALGHPDYGWGVYNMATHSVTGDSLYIINLPEVGYKKLWIVDKISVQNTYHIRYANLDGSDEMTATIDANPYTDKNFIYYSLETHEIIDREPALDWDLLFTKYIDFTEDMSGNMSEYLVTGATSNVDHFANKFTEVGVDFDDWASKPMDSLKNTVGYDWKSFSMSTMSWAVDDSTAFFVKNTAGDVYKLIFTYWAGMGSGEFALNKEMISASAIEDIVMNENIISLYPNPANQNITVDMKDTHFEGNIRITDVSGRVVYQSKINHTKSVDVSSLSKGIYFVSIFDQNYLESQKLIIK